MNKSKEDEIVMAHVLEKVNSTKCALDASKSELFTQKKFSDLIFDNHNKGLDYFLARIHCREKDQETGKNIYYCYDAKQLCKYIFEMLVTSEGRKIKIKNFRDPVNNKEIGEINFFKLRHDSETPLKAEFLGNHVNFLESSIFRSKIFSQENDLESLSVNFQILKPGRSSLIKKRRLMNILILLFLLLVSGGLILLGFKSKKIYISNEKATIPTKPEQANVTV